MRFLPILSKLRDRWLGAQGGRTIYRQADRRTNRPRSVTLGLELLECRIAPAIRTWVGGAAGNTNLNWSNAANWQGGVAPTNNDDIVFPAGTINRITNNDIPNLTLNSITIQGSGYTLNSSANHRVTLASPQALLVNAGSVNNAITFDVRLQGGAGSKQFIEVNAGAQLTLSGIMSGAGVEMSKTGTGVLTLSGDNNSGPLSPNSFTGPITVTQGILRITHEEALGTPEVGTTIQQNAELQLVGINGTVSELLTLSGSGVTSDGVVRLLSGNAILAGPVQMDASITLGADAAATMTLTGQINDLGAGYNLTKEGAGTIVFTRDNSYRGLTTINNGILRIEHPLALGPALGTTESGTIVNASPTTGSGALQLSDPTGVGFTVFNERLTLNGPLQFSPDPFVSPQFALGSLHNLSGNNTWAGTVTLGSLPPDGSNVRIGVAAGTELTISGVIQDDPALGTPWNLTKILPGRLIFNNANTYRGFTTIAAGVLNIRDSQALGEPALSQGTQVNAGATLELEVDTGLDAHGRDLSIDSLMGTTGNGPQLGLTIQEDLTIAGLGANNLGALRSISGINKWISPITLTTANAGIGVDQDPVGSNTNLYFTNDYSLTVGTAEVQVLTVAGGSGTYQLTFNGASTPVGALPFNASAAQIQAALNALPTIGGVGGSVLVRRVAPGVNQFRISFVGSFIGANQSTMTATGSALPAVTPLVDGGSPSLVGGGTTFQKLGAGHLILPNRNTWTGRAEINQGWVTIQHERALGNFIAGGDTIQPGTTVAAGAALHLKPLSPTGTIRLVENLLLAGTGISHPFQLINEKGALVNLGGNNTIGGPVNFGAEGIRSSDIQLRGIAGIGVELLDPHTESELTITSSISESAPVPLTLNVGGAAGGGEFTTGPIDTAATSGTITINYDMFVAADRLTVYYPPRGVPGSTLLGDTGLVTGTGTLVVNYGPGTSTEIEIVMNEGDPFGTPIWDFTATITPNAASGAGGINKLGSKRLNLQGDGTYSGEVRVSEGVLRAQHDTALGLNSSSTINPTGNQTYTDSITRIGDGIRELQSLTVTGVTGPQAEFTLTFDGETTARMPHGVTASELEARLNALASIARTGGFVKVNQSGNVYTVSFEGSFVGLNQPQLIVSQFGGLDVAVRTLMNGDGAALELKDSNPLNAGGVSAGLNIWHEHLILGGRGNNEFGLESLAILSNDHLWHGPITLAGAPVAEAQTLTITGASGSFTLTFDGQTTSSLPFNATAAQIESALRALPSIRDVDGNVLVSKSGSNIFTVRFVSSFLGLNPSQLIATPTGGVTVAVATPTEGSSGSFIQIQPSARLTVLGKIDDNDVAEVQVITVQRNAPSPAGTFRITFEGQSTPDLPFDASASLVQAALNALPTIGGVGGSVTVTATAIQTLFQTDPPDPTLHDNVYTVTFGGSLLGRNQLQMTTTSTSDVNTSVSTRINGAAGSNLTLVGGGQLALGNISQTTLDGISDFRGSALVEDGVLLLLSSQALGDVGVAELQRVTVVPAVGPNQGTFTLTFDGATTPVLAANATAAQIQTALNNLPTIGGPVGGFVIVTQTGNQFEIAFHGSLFGFDQPTIIPRIVDSGNVDPTQALSVKVLGVRDGIGGTVVSDGSALQLQGSLTIAAEPLILQGQGSQLPAGVPQRWFNVGPAPTNNGETVTNQGVSGRVTGVAVDPTDERVIYIATAGGGAWKTKDGGQSWLPLFDQRNGISEVQQIEVTSNTAGQFFTLTFAGAQTVVLPYNATALDVQSALNNLASVGGVQGSVTVNQVGAPEQQTVTVTGVLVGETNGFTLTFGGHTTGRIRGDATAAEVAQALNALPSLADIGAYVTVTKAANEYTISFRGSLLGYNQVPLIATNIGSTVATVAEIQNGLRRFEVTFAGNLANRDVQQIVASGNAGVTVSTLTQGVLPNGSPETQRLVVGNTVGTYQLTYNGTPTIALVWNSTALQIQAALNTILAPEGGSVVVTRDPRGQNLFSITFGGALTGRNVNQLGVINGGAGASVTTIADGVTENNFLFGGAIAIAPSDPRIIYFGTGETNNATNLSPLGGLNNASDSFYGTGVYKSVDSGKTWTLLIDDTPDPGTGFTQADAIPQSSNPLYGLGVSKISVDPFDPHVIYVATGDQSANRPPQIIPSRPGVYRYDAAAPYSKWFNLTSIVTSARGGSAGQTGAPPNAGRLPGPDDDFRIDFHQTGVTWSDVEIIYTVIANRGAGPGFPVPVLYAALGTATETGGQAATHTGQPRLPHNGVFRTENPQLGASDATSPPVWISGDPQTAANEVQRIILSPWQTVTERFQLSFNSGGAVRVPGGPFFGWTVDPNLDPTLPAGINSLAAAIQAALNSLPTIAGPGGSVTVTLNAGLTNNQQIVLDVTFGGTMTNTNQPPIQIHPSNPAVWNGGTITTVQDGGGVDDRRGGFPAGAKGNANNGTIKFDVVPGPTRDTTSIFASVATPGTGTLLNVFRSIFVSPTVGGGGENWAAAPNAGLVNYMANQGHYNNAIVARDVPNPSTQPVTLYVGGHESNSLSHDNHLFRSADSGATWANTSTDITSRGPHTSHHAMALDSQGRLIVGTDGGVWRYDPVADRWSNLTSNLAISQFNSIAGHPTDLGIAYGGTRFNGLTIYNADQAWERRDPIDGRNDIGRVRVDPSNPNIVYYVENASTLSVNNPPILGTTEWTSGPNSAVLRVSLNALDPNPTWTTLLTLPGNRYFPFVIDPINPMRIVVGDVSGLQESFSRGNPGTWIDLNPPISVTGVAVASYQGRYAGDPSFQLVADKGSNTYDPDTIYVVNGAAGALAVTKNHGVTWVRRDPPGADQIRDIVVDPRNRDVVYVVGTSVIDGGPRIWRSTNAGQSWTTINGAGLPSIPIWKLVFDPRNETVPGDAAESSDDVLYVGTDSGVYRSLNGGASWERFGAGLANVRVTDLELNLANNTLLAGTYGRSMYQIFLEDGQQGAGALRTVSGSSVWNGPIRLLGSADGNEVVIAANGTQSLLDGIAGSQLSILGTIRDVRLGENPTLVKLGQGDVVLSGANVHGGVTEVREGVLVVRNANALGTLTSDTQTVTVNDSAGTFTLTFNDHTTVTLDGDASAADVQTALNDLPSIGGVGGNVTVSKTGNVFTIAFGGTLAGIDQPLFSVGGSAAAAVASVANGTGLTPEIQTVAVTATSGMFTLTFDGQTTVPVAFNVPATGGTLPSDSLENALNALSSISGVGGYVTVSKSGNVYSILFGGTLAGYNQPLMIANGAGTIVGAQAISVSGITGTFTLTYEGQTTAPLAINATAADVQTALNALPTISGVGGSVTVTKSGNVFTVIFNGTLRGDNQSLLSALGFGGTSVVVQGPRQGAGGTIVNGRTREVQTVTVPSGAGTFTLTFDGQTTPALSFNATPAQVAQQLNLLTTIGGVGGRVEVTRLQLSNTYTITFGGALAGRNVSQLVAAPGTVQVATLQQGAGTTLETQAINVTGTSGSFTLSFNGFTTGSLPFNATPTAVETALNLLPSIGGLGGIASVSQIGTTYIVTFAGTFAGLNVSQLVAGGTAAATVSTLRHGNIGLGQTALETQTVNVTGTAGFFSLTFKNDTATLPIGATADQVAVALNNLASVAGVGGQVRVIQLGNNLYTVIFVGAFSGLDVPQMLGGGSGGGNATVSTARQGGPSITDTAIELESDLELEPIRLNGNGIEPAFNTHRTGALRSVSNQNTFTGTIILGTDSTIGVDSGSVLTIGMKPGLAGAGTITDGGTDRRLVKELTGTLVLASANTYGGVTDVIQGALRVQHSLALGSAGTAANGTRVSDGAQVQIQTPVIGPFAGLPVVVSDERLYLSGTGIDGTGALRNTGGSNVWRSDTLGAQSLITMTAFPGFAPVTQPPGTVAFGVTAAGDSLTIDGHIGQVLPAQFVYPNGYVLEQAMNLDTGLRKVGPGTLILADANTYVGTTYIADGVVRIQHGDALGTTNRNEVQRVIVSRSVTSPILASDTFTLTFNGSTTPSLSFATATAADVANALNGLASIQNLGGVVTVTLDTVYTGLANNETALKIFTVTFGGALVGRDLPQMSALGANLTTAVVNTVADGQTGTLVRPVAGSLGAALEIDGDPTNLGAGFGLVVAAESIGLSGTGPNGTGALRNVSGHNILQGNLALVTDNSISVSPNSELLVQGTVEDFIIGRNWATGQDLYSVPTAGLTKIGEGRLVFDSNRYTITFGGSLAGTNVAQLTGVGSFGASVSITTVKDGIFTTLETQTLRVNGSSGTFHLTFNGADTIELPFNATAAQVEAALNALPTIGGVNGVARVTMNTYSGKTTVAEGILNIRDREALGISGGEQQTVTVLGASGTFSLNFNGAQTVAIDILSPTLALDIQRALNDLPTISSVLDVNGLPSTVTVTQGAAPATNVFTVTFGGRLALANLARMIPSVSPGVSVEVQTLRDGPEGTVVNSGATLEVEMPNSTVSTEPLNLSGAGVNGAGALVNVSGVNTWTERGITLSANTTIGAVNPAGSLTINEGITEAQQITVLGTAGTFQVSFKGQTTASLPFSASADQLRVALEGLSAIGPGNVTVTKVGNVFTITFVGLLGLSAQPPMTAVGTGGTTAFVSPAGFSVTKVGAGAIEFAGTIANTYTGPTAVNEGLLRLNKQPVSEVQQITVLGTSGQFRVSFNGSTTPAFGAPGVLMFNATEAQLQTALENLPSIGAGNVLVRKTGNVFTITFTGALANQNVPAFTTQVSGGTTATVTQVLDGRSADPAIGVAIPSNLTIGDATGGAATVQLLASHQILNTASVTIHDDGTLNVGTFQELIGPLTLIGGRVLTGVGGVLTLGGNVTADSTANRRASIEGPGSLNLGTATRTFTVADGPQTTDLFIDAVIAGSAGLGVVKTGAGQMELDAVNTYTGLTTLNNGTLQVDGVIQDVTLVSPGGVLQGTGTVGVLAGVVGEVSPGDGTTGILHSGNVTWTSQNTFRVELRGTSLVPTVQHDQLNVTGTVNLGNANLIVDLGAYVPATGNRFTILQSTGQITGQFAQGDTLFVNGMKFRVEYNMTSVVLERIQAITTAVVTSVHLDVVTGNVTFTAAVTPEAQATFGTPTGTITFRDRNGTVVLGTPATLSGGQATIVRHISTLGLSPHDVTAEYSGDADFLPHTSAPFTFGDLRVMSVAPANPIVGGLNEILITFNRAVSPNTFQLSDDDVQLIAPNGLEVLLLNALLAPTDSTNTVWRLSNLPPLTTPGVYTLRVGPAISDVANFSMDQNANGINGEVPAGVDNRDQFVHSLVVGGLAVTQVEPNTVLAATGIESITIHFNMSVNPATFSLADVELRDPSNNLISLAGATLDPLNGGNSIWRIILPTTLNQPGTYSLRIGPNVEDLAGNPMNQNGNAIYGEAADAFTGPIVIQALVVNSITMNNPLVTPLASATADITFNMPVNPGTFSLAQGDIVLLDADNNPIALTGASLMSLGDGSVWRLTFTPPSTAGVYRLRVGPNITDSASSFQMDQNANGILGQNGVAPVGDQFERTFVVDGLAVASITPATPVPGSIGVSSITINFNMPVDPLTFTLSPADVRVFDPDGTEIALTSGGVPLAGVSLVPINTSNRNWRLTLPSTLRRAGTYTIQVGPNVLDTAGNAMNQNRNGLFGESPGDRFTGNFVIEGLRVTNIDAPNPSLTPGASISALITFNMPVNPSSFQLSEGDVQLLGPNGASIPLTGATLMPTSPSNTVWRLTFTAPSNAGVYTIRVGPNVNDAAGFAMDQNGNGTLGQTGVAPNGDQFDGFFVVDGLAVTSISTLPDPVLSNSATADIRIDFNMAVNPATFTLADVVLLDPLGNPVSLAGANLAPTSAANTTWLLTLPTSVRQPGTYTLQIGPDVRDTAGNAMNQTRDGTLGAADDRFSGTFVIQGLKVTSVVTPNPLVPPTPSASAIITFNMPVDLTSFRLSEGDVLLFDPNGNPVPLVNGSGAALPGVALVSTNAQNTVWRLDFPAPTVAGVYTITVGPGIRNVAGEEMDQNSDGLLGQANDIFTGTFVVTGLRVNSVTTTPTTPVLNSTGVTSATITFNIPVGTFTLNDLELRDATGALVSLAGSTLTPNANRTVWTLTFNQIVRRPGQWSLIVRETVTDEAGNRMNQNQNSVIGENPGDRFTANFTLTGLKVESVGSLINPVLDTVGLSQFVITFNQPVAVGSFDLGDLQLTGPAPLGNIALTGASLIPNSTRTVWTLTLGASQARMGNYVLRVGPGITDDFGFAMDQNDDGLLGQAADVFTGTVTVTGLAVVGVAANSLDSSVGMSSITVVFNEGVLAGTLQAVTSLLNPSGVPITPLTVTDLTLGGSNRHDVWQITFAPQTAAGTYTLTIGSTVRSLANNPMDQNQNGVGGEILADRYVAPLVVGTQPVVRQPQPEQFATETAAPISFIVTRRRRGNRFIFVVRIFLYEGVQLPPGSRLVIATTNRRDRMPGAMGRTRRGQQFRVVGLDTATLRSNPGLGVQVVIRTDRRNPNLAILPILSDAPLSFFI